MLCKLSASCNITATFANTLQGIKMLNIQSYDVRYTENMGNA